MVTLLALLATTAGAQVTLPHYDGFNYTAGTMLRDQGGWIAVNSGDTVWVSAGNLSYTGFPASNGNKITFNGAGQEQTKLFTSVATGTVYYSYLLKVTSLAGIKAESYVSGFYQSATSTTTGTLVWIKPDGTGFAIGVSARTVPNAPVNYHPTTQSLNTTYLIVAAYQFVDGATNDSAKIWINPDASTFGKTPPAPSAVSVNAATDLTGAARFVIRQDADTTTAFCEMDELRLGTSWADVTQAISATNVVEEIDGLAPRTFSLEQNYPNPFNPSTAIRFSVASSGHVSLNVTDVLGRQVASLVDEILTPGTYSVQWNASSVPSGVYFYTVRSGGMLSTKRMILAK
jgi:hypothetical protein